MTRSTMVSAAALLAFGLAAVPAAGQGIAFKGWGVRAGIADDPDQGVAGVQLDLGEVVPKLHFQPRVELGLGDDTTIVSATLPVLYRVPVARRLNVYGGGGVTFGLIDRDPPRRGQAAHRLALAGIRVLHVLRLVEYETSPVHRGEALDVACHQVVGRQHEVG